MGNKYVEGRVQKCSVSNCLYHCSPVVGREVSILVSFFFCVLIVISISVLFESEVNSGTFLKLFKIIFLCVVNFHVRTSH